MAINVIDSTNSLTDQLFDGDTEAFLLVKESGSIVTNGAFASTYYTSATGTTATINGSLISEQGNGIYIGGGSAQITVGASGIVGGGASGLQVNGGDSSVINAGLIYGANTYTGTVEESCGIYFGGTVRNRLTNSGSITGYYGVYGDGTATLDLKNSGTISSDSEYAVLAKDWLIMTNSGLIQGLVYSYSYSVINNTGTIIGGAYVARTGSYASFYNYGDITGVIYTGSSGDYVSNYGTAGSINADDGSDIVINAGFVRGSVTIGSGGTLSFDNDSFTNTGRVGGNVSAGVGDDTIDSSTGVINGVVDLGDGNDTYTGGAGIDRVVGGLGVDTIDLGDGRDVYRATDGDGNDDLDGGDGIDTYNAAAVTTTITINLGAATTGNAVGNDTIAGFENLIGGSAADNLSGDDGANRIDGQDGADVIFGDEGRDRLIGGLGTDTITGGLGRDILTGGKAGSQESDRFVFVDGDSGTTASTRDVITDFRDHRSNVPAMYLSNPDQINLSAIDANTGVAGDQAFSFNELKGAAFSGAAGSLVWQQFTGFALISGDTNGDGKADFVIQLSGTHGLFTSDFVL